MRKNNIKQVMNIFERKHNNGLNFRRRRRRIRTDKLQYGGIYALEILIAILLAFLLVKAFGIQTSMAGESMTPTIQNNDTVLLNKAIYLIKGPRKNDIIAFYPDGNTNAKISIKRVVGVPGDRVVIKSGHLYVNDNRVVDIADTESMNDAGIASSEITLKNGEYFVLGDNRNNSEDSRYETIGNVKKSQIVGKVWFDFDLHNFGRIH